jgi:hypothetical protein
MRVIARPCCCRVQCRAAAGSHYTYRRGTPRDGDIIRPIIFKELYAMLPLAEIMACHIDFVHSPSVQKYAFFEANVISHAP